ncbi:response regulator [Caballeronia temeraria]|uniref:response regulator n=1 Tax=Caballeronia temeraria TaxID=1777137 RepID=UPI000772AA51|nr:response regulator [Caballeronia temeraria]
MTKVLFVDDDRNTADALSDIAAALGHRPSVAYTGACALQVASSARFDLVFLDLSLPDADGRTVCRQMRDLKVAKIYALTGYTETKAADDLEIFDGCFVKPLCIDRLQALLAAHW